MAGNFLKGEEQKGLSNINFESDTFSLVPMATTYTPDYQNHQFYSDVSAEIASGASPIVLTGVTYNIGTGIVSFDSADISVASQTWTSNKFIIKKDTGTPATEVLIHCGDFAVTQTPVAGTFTYTVAANGHFSIASA